MTTKKTAGTKATTTPATADDEKLEELVEPTAVEKETAAEQQEEEPRTFTATINGEEREFKDMTGGTLPAAAMFMSNNRLMEKYAPVLFETILGEDQLMDLMFEGLELKDLSDVLVSWVKSRNLGN